jgi:hypothetical protein
MRGLRLRVEQSTRSALPIPARGRAAGGDAVMLEPAPGMRTHVPRLSLSGGGSCQRDHGRRRLRPHGLATKAFSTSRDFLETNVLEPDFCTSYIEAFDDVCLRSDG